MNNFDKPKDYVLKEHLFLFPNRTFILNEDFELEIKEKTLFSEKTFNYRIDVLSPTPLFTKGNGLKWLISMLLSFIVLIIMFNSSVPVFTISIVFLIMIYQAVRFIQSIPNKYILANQFSSLPLVEFNETDANKKQLSDFFEELKSRTDIIFGKDMVSNPIQSDLDICSDYLHYLYRSNFISREIYSIESERLNNENLTYSLH